MIGLHDVIWGALSFSGDDTEVGLLVQFSDTAVDSEDLESVDAQNAGKRAGVAQKSVARGYADAPDFHTVHELYKHLKARRLLSCDAALVDSGEGTHDMAADRVIDIGLYRCFAFVGMTQALAELRQLAVDTVAGPHCTV